MLKKVFALLSISLTVAACTAPTQQANEQTIPSTQEIKEAKLTPVKAGHLVALDMAPLFVGVESGCFKKYGLDLQTVAFTNPGDNNAALAGGSIDFSTNPFTLPFFAASSGVPIKTISAAGGWGIMQVIAKSEYKLKSVDDLAKYISQNPGKKLHIATLRGDTLELILVNAFQKHKISSQSVEMVYFDDLLAMVEAFRNSQVDLLSHIKPYTTQFVTEGKATVITDNAEVWSPTTPNTVVSVLEKTLQGKPEIVKSYVQGLRCAAEIINTKPEEAVNLLENGNYYRVDKAVLLEAFKSQPSPITFTPDLSAIQEVVDEMVELKYIRTDVPASKIFDLQIVKSLESQPVSQK